MISTKTLLTTHTRGAIVRREDSLWCSLWRGLQRYWCRLRELRYSQNYLYSETKEDNANDGWDELYSTGK